MFIDEALINENYLNFNIPCYSCNKFDHKFSKCLMIFLTLNK